MSLWSAGPCSGSTRAFRPEYRCRGLKSPVRSLCTNSFFTIPSDTLNRCATSALVPSCPSYAATIRSLKSNDNVLLIPVLYQIPTCMAIVLFKML
jgi:hypothetical protein